MTVRSQPRVLLIGPDYVFGWTSSTARALEGLGCHVLSMFYNKSRLRRRVRGLRKFLSQRSGIRLLSTPHWVQKWHGLWLGWQAGRALILAARGFHPDLLLILKGESISPDHLRELKSITRAKLAVWWLDHPLINAETGRVWQYLSECVPLYDRCFVFDRPLSNERLFA